MNLLEQSVSFKLFEASWKFESLYGRKKTRSGDMWSRWAGSGSGHSDSDTGRCIHHSPVVSALGRQPAQETKLQKESTEFEESW